MIPVIIGLLFACVWAGPKFSFNESKSTLEITQTWQFWAVGMPDPQTIPQPDKRLDLYIRRARLGFKGQAYPRLDYQTQFAYDNLGKDPYTGTTGTPQKLEMTEFKVLDAYFTYHIDSAFANITFGLFKPQVSRAFINSFSKVTSLEHTLSCYYLRAHCSARPSAREIGVNLGGSCADSNRLWGVSYNTGVFDAVQEKNPDLAGSLQWSPLIAGRIAFSLSDTDSYRYALASDINYFGRRHGITIGVYGTHQGQVDEVYEPKDTVYVSSGKLIQKTMGYKGGFKRNNAYGADLLCNFAGFELDGEYTFMRREFSGEFRAANPAAVKSGVTMDKVWHVRGSYSFPLPSDMFLEPSVMYTRFDGDAASMTYPSGIDSQLDVGVKWYINKNGFKVSLHYLDQDGRARSMYTAGPSNGTQKVRDDFLALAVQIGI